MKTISVSDETYRLLVANKPAKADSPAAAVKCAVENLDYLRAELRDARRARFAAEVAAEALREALDRVGGSQPVEKGERKCGLF